MATFTPRFNAALGSDELPADVRLMQGVANAVFALAALALAVGALLWLMRAPFWQIRAIHIDGDLSRNSIGTIRANAAPKLAGNFLSLDLQKARLAFESVPWVRQALVRKVWPNQLAVRLYEHRAEALWEGSDGVERLVNDHGEIFEANLGDVEDDNLPTLSGPQGSSAKALSMLRRLQPLFARLKAEVSTLRLTGRGSWRVELDNDATVELGRGTEDEVVARTERFTRTLPQLTARFEQRPLEYADLRHPDGYAVRLRGLGTTAATPKN